MSVQRMREASDCQSTDWTTIGTRILHAATLAAAVHMDEQAKAAGEGLLAGTEIRQAMSGLARESGQRAHE